MARWQLSTWILAARPKTLVASICPVVIATAMAYGSQVHHWPSALAALLGAVLIQIGTNFANDYSDFQKGADTPRRLGPLRVTQAGLISAEEMKRATALVFGLASLIGLCLIWRAGWPMLIIGIASILAGVLYTGGPYPLGYLGLGDLFVFIFFGPVALVGAYYVQALAITSPVVIASFAPGFLITAILVVNNLRDIDEDRQTGKKTLAVRLGRGFTLGEYFFVIGLASLIPILLYIRSGEHPASLLSVLVIVAAVPAFKTALTKTDGPSLNRLLGQTGELLTVYSVLFSLGWLL
jgi:1,4-dihydroxy-2-naphthoate polyprenyltransferase